MKFSALKYTYYNALSNSTWLLLKLFFSNILDIIDTNVQVQYCFLMHVIEVSIFFEFCIFYSIKKY